jgi:hypothetical protein
MPKRESRGEVSWPVRVVAPTKVKRSIGHGDRGGPGAHPSHDLDLEVLHGRIEAFFNNRLQPMDLVDEQHVAAAE